MKKLSDKKIDKLIKNHLDGMLIGPNARQLKKPETPQKDISESMASWDLPIRHRIRI
jgi:hypothetical protein